jgi:hypothetical protein
MRMQITLVLLSVQLGGCSILQQDRRDAPWDPRGSAQLMDQIPNWTGGAMRRCGGQVRPELRTADMTDRC